MTRIELGRHLSAAQDALDAAGRIIATLDKAEWHSGPSVALEERLHHALAAVVVATGRAGDAARRYCAETGQGTLIT